MKTIPLSGKSGVGNRPETAPPGSLHPVVRHRSYDEACRDANASAAERENALLAEHVRAVREIEWLWSCCKIVYCPKDGRHPIEHDARLKKFSRELIEAQMPNGRGERPGPKDAHPAEGHQETQARRPALERPGSATRRNKV
jgi:hypothetical protein